ncbi:hypothetical protein A4S05_10310 [Nostoc sp. KVJ20]|uniref:hypothetical protein n=1 Tax=Nostoc sp. KVJ20 TaxID=457944 RepID=UPI00083CC842|nr:hypothetical protein [Nostoc sp. KVJ20]ODG98189.1 hypothetical protein A4S05_10310 [Nostoc sp. KVJ20]
MSNYNVMASDNFAIEELTLVEQEMIQGGGIVGGIIKGAKWAWKNKTTIALAAYEVYDAVVGD